jgi:glycosyltransferase involved in cell wall biosynthesis
MLQVSRRCWHAFGKASLKPRLAIVGARGIPARWGGFETVASELAPRLVERGFDVTVYCRLRYSLPKRPPTFRGVKLRYLPAPRGKAAESLVHEALCAADQAVAPADLILVLGFRAAFAFALPALRGAPVFFNTDGLDWKRRKWGRLARWYLRANERAGVKISRKRLICDSREIRDYFSQTYDCRPAYISYGASTAPPTDEAWLEDCGLQPGGYHLVVARLEPENNVDIAIKAHRLAGGTLPLVIVGAANYRSRYVNSLLAQASASVRFLGGIYGEGQLERLLLGCCSYIHGHEVGGTNPMLLQAMALRAPILAVDVPYTREVLAAAARYWTPDPASLAPMLRWAEERPEDFALLASEGHSRVRALYDWGVVADQYAEYFRHYLATSELLHLP